MARAGMVGRGMRVAGIHSPNNKAVTTDDLTMWQGINPSVILLCQPDFALARELKERIPGVYIIGRVFGGNGFDAWHPRWSDTDWMYRYGVYCGQIANQFAVDAIQFANEPGIDDNNPAMWTREGYEAQAHGSDHWLRGYRSVTNKDSCTCPQSPGHKFDDDPDGSGWTGAGIVKDVWQQFDVLLCHSYMTRDPGTIESEWWGRRYRREVAALGWTKRTIVTETNRDEPTPPNDEDRKSLAEFYRQWYAGSEVESCFFIWDTADPNFARLTMKDNPWLIDVAAEANTRVVDPAPPIPEPETPVLPDWTREAIIALIIAFSDAAGVPRRLSLACGIAESNLRQYATREGAWPDVSYGLGQQIVLFAPVGDGTNTPANRERVKAWLFDPNNAVPLMVGKLAANYDNRIKAGYSDLDAQMMALAKYNSNQWTIPASHSGNYLNYERGFREADAILATLPPREEDVNAEQVAAIKTQLDAQWGTLDELERAIAAMRRSIAAIKDAAGLS